jgi:hypothetical protein
VRRLATLVPLMALLAAGCMGGEKAAFDRSGLKALVLQQQDLPRAFVRFDEGRQARLDQPGGTLADAERFGRQDGWKARYRRPGSAATTGPLVVESKIDVFEKADGASKELDAMRADLVEGLRLVDGAPALGDESFVATGTQGTGRFAVRFYLVGWRHDNASASVFANGFDRKFTRDQAVELARKQERRIEAADS